MDRPATTTIVRTFSWSVVPLTRSIAPRMTRLVRNVRTILATPFSRATGAKPKGLVTCRSRVPHCTSLPMSFEMEEYAPTDSVHRK